LTPSASFQELHDLARRVTSSDPQRESVIWCWISGPMGQVRDAHNLLTGGLSDYSRLCPLTGQATRLAPGCGGANGEDSGKRLEALSEQVNATTLLG
jgi:hypothetical protein